MLIITLFYCELNLPIAVISYIKIEHRFGQQRDVRIIRIKKSCSYFANIFLLMAENFLNTQCAESEGVSIKLFIQPDSFKHTQCLL